MKYSSYIFVTLAFALAGHPALAQMAPGMGPGMGGDAGAPHPLARTPDIAPPALPGAAVPPVATGPTIAKPAIGDPTTALFAAVNSGDYNAAQDAISRGANLNAQNALGETPLGLAVALNRSTITFLILSARNEDGGGASDANAGPAPAMPVMAKARAGSPVSNAAGPASTARIAVPVMGNNPGTPDPAAGFLGFGGKS
ncbi:MAG: ankyrin repeat domain-containing protein [Acidocella sp.]|nr:ankyrin repeat domain-containing protein [Acidocella sp.]